MTEPRVLLVVRLVFVVGLRVLFVDELLLAVGPRALPVAVALFVSAEAPNVLSGWARIRPLNKRAVAPIEVVAPCSFAGRVVDLDPLFVDPTFVDPAFVDPAFVDLVVDPAFVGPELVVPVLP